MPKLRRLIPSGILGSAKTCVVVPSASVRVRSRSRARKPEVRYAGFVCCAAAGGGEVASGTGARATDVFSSGLGGGQPVTTGPSTVGSSSMGTSSSRSAGPNESSEEVVE